jgi:long-chain fatty acid transport protein
MKATMGRAAAATAIAAMAAGEAGATAFQLREGSATAIGSALAGRTANDADVSLSIHNPASLRGVRNIELSFGSNAIFPDGDATFQGAPVGGLSTNGDGYGVSALVPSFTVGWRYDPNVIFGLAVDVPFGLSTEYDSDFAGGFDGVKSELTTITVTPMIAWEATPGLAFGAGFSFQYADAELTTRVGVGPNDIASISGDGFSGGFTMGMIAEPLDGTQIGVNFQSGFDHDLEGSFSNNFPSVGGQPGEAAFNLPPLASIGLIQSITDEFRVMGEFEWTGWSAFDTLVISSNGTTVQDDVQNYNDSFMVSLGAEYDVTDALTVRAGAAFDKTPTTDRWRTVRTPDGDRYWLAAGASYQITERIGIDAAYLYILVDDASVTLRNSPSAGTQVDYDDGDVHLLSLNLRYAF